VKQDNVFMPPRVKEVPIDSAQDSTPETIKRLKTEVEQAGLYRQVAQEKILTDQLLNPQSPEPPFKVSGAIDLGTFNLQEQQQRASQEASLARQQAEARIDKVTEELNQTRQLLQTTQMQALQQGFERELNILREAIQKGQANQPDFLTQMATIEALAEKLGFSRQTTTPGTDFQTQIALKKLEAEMQREQRNFDLRMEQDKREWTLELRKLDGLNKQEEARLQAEKEKLETLARIPEQIGFAFAKGIMDHEESPNTGISNKASHPRTVAGEIGEAGQFDCEACGTKVAVGPTSTQTMCSKCGQLFNIIRTPPENQQSKQEQGQKIY